jgi:DAK2 domain fusion protein YloV
MELKVLDGARFARIVLAARHCLEANKEHVNALNVFPIPDGDTGTNMSLTFASGVQEMLKYQGAELHRQAQALASGLLMGARGNSGVILSQLFRGFAQSVASRSELDARQLADALQNGVNTAYRAVVKPVEGTILTVAKDAAKAAQKAAKKRDASIRSVFQALLEEAERSLARTPERLPILREAGVVDSGGQGLVYIYKGFLAAVNGEELGEEIREWMDHFSNEGGRPTRTVLFHETDEFGYCTEFFIRVENRSMSDEQAEERVREALGVYGNSLLVVADNHRVKVHIHAMRPGVVLERAMDFGPLFNIKIDNMTEQFHRLHGREDEQEADVGTHMAANPRKRYAIVTVAAGEGIADIFQSLGAARVVDGGESMNPSTEDILRAVEETMAEHVFVLPNHGNVIMAAEQARQVMPDRIHVIPSRSIPQGIAAMLAFHEDRSLEDNRTGMTEALGRVKSAAITRAVRDSQYQGQEIREGDYIGLFDGQVVAIHKELELTARGLLEKIMDEKDELVTVFYGEPVNREDAEKLVERLAREYGQYEFELRPGGQPIYDYILSIE